MYPWAGQPPASPSLMLDRILGVTPSYTWNPQLENKGKGRVLPGFYNLAFVPTHLQLHQPHPSGLPYSPHFGTIFFRKKAFLSKTTILDF